MKRCKHKHTVITWRATEHGHVVFARHCASCDLRLSIGPSNDTQVAVEIRAAELAVTYASADEFEIGVQLSTMEPVERNGYVVIPGSVGEWNGYVDREQGADLPRDHLPDEQAGWLAQAIHAHDAEQSGDEQPELVDDVPDSTLDGIDQSEPTYVDHDIGGES